MDIVKWPGRIQPQVQNCNEIGPKQKGCNKSFTNKNTGMVAKSTYNKLKKKKTDLGTSKHCDCGEQDTNNKALRTERKGELTS